MPKKLFKRKNLILLILLLFFSCTNKTQLKQTKPKEYFPLTKGTYWIYKGTVKWQQGETKGEKKVTLKMEVIKTITEGHLFIAVIKGFPIDWDWYGYDINKGIGQQGDYLIVRVGTSLYYLLTEKEKIKQFLNNEGALERVTESDLLFDTPFEKGRIFGETQYFTRDEKAYFWYVKDEKQTTFPNVSGLDPKQTYTNYTLLLKTNPGDEIIEFVPGIGITGYEYVHHGTVAETYLKLSEFHQQEKQY